MAHIKLNVSRRQVSYWCTWRLHAGSSRIRGFKVSVCFRLTFSELEPQGNSLDEIQRRARSIQESEYEPDSFVHNVYPGNL